ncbi:Phospholipase-like protein D1 [Venustampulla echinocandica]|uniref:Phospholipase D1 n=1 Tax=Venustampulla echinocandica TaxID=2656787 RepID=A0A370TPY0_9HELO|nr:Phospholipase-like protein D1 [Venustampulla echinocandica]RDL37576.1 Phospholipase-like protein D1 [Venustampulla echinocandica]
MTIDGEEISPMTTPPERASNGSANGSANVLVQPSGLRNVVGSDSVLETKHDVAHPSAATNGSTSKPSTEAPDYMNGGYPHENIGSVAPSALKPPTLKPPFAANDVPTTAAAGTSTPPGRRSVQFARAEVSPEDMGHGKQESLGAEDGETPSKDRRGQSLMAKLKLLTSAGGLQTHSRSQSNPVNSADGGTVSAPLSPVNEHRHRFPYTLQEEGSDADAEETADEDVAPDVIRVKRKRRMPRPQFSTSESQTTPNTPRVRGIAQSDSPSGSRVYPFLSRRATDGSLEQRGHVSEGEGRDQLGGHSAWRRGSSWISSARGFGHSAQHSADLDATPTSRRPGQFRRALTGLGGGQSDGDGPASRRPFMGAERTPTFGAQRWRMIKHGLKLLGTKKEEHRVDYLKSAELMAELRAGAPAALILASMIQRDEHGNKRIPVLLEQLKIRITDSKSSTDDPAESGRHLIFRIELEYGSGLNRMKWVIHRTLRDFANLHLRYKIQAQSDKYLQLRSDVDSRPKQPRFPRSAFPYFRGVRGLGESEDDEPDNIRIDETVGEATHSETDRKRKKRRPSLGGSRRKSTAMGTEPTSGSVAPKGESNAQTRIYNEKQRRRLEQYLQEMIRWLIFRADSNRLCRFLELSALGVRLAAEGSYHGKEGFMVIQASKGLDFRRLLTPRKIFARHSPKWFLVRHSYIVCVESPENMHIYDVYLVDPKFEIQQKRRKLRNMGSKEILNAAEESAKHPQHHSLKLHNSERKVKLLAKNERQLRQFEESITFMVDNTSWSKPNRFGSFAPVRTGVYAQWLVDGRDYMWNVSRAINMAKDVIYIHDWWLSPQLYMRRPAAISQKWRLDRLLQKKAKEGVKIFIIIYRNVEAAIPIDSEFTKFSMLDLHPNVFVQRSPNQFKKNQFFFAHHEKICIVDHTVAFVGGIDLCFGRWDTPQHSVVDDKPTGFEQSDLPKDADHCQLWPGKDYSNPRVQDFYQLHEPYAEMYDRSKIPRMPWHDISMQVVGQPARDLTRHFVQRWNYVLRGRKPTRPTPFLLPPPDYNTADLEALGLSGTCEVQILRSAADWSMGLTETEHSIMNAYCKMIEESEHFVYMENQFFITSCETMNVKIINKIGDAIVERAVRAFRNNESWRCVILIPLMPGFQNTVDEPEGTSVRLIMQCQFRSICRGEGSIFGRLRSQGIEPEDFVQFYSLRSWGRIGPKKTLVTEQLYIHAKVIIVDDRTALIGSANINERSMLGSRDSECAAVVRDTDMIWSTMDGEPYLVGRFAHTLRMRLMREHLGLDVDEVMEDERRAELDKEEEEYESKMDGIYGDDSDSETDRSRHGEVPPEVAARRASLHTTRSFNHDVDWEEDANPYIKPEPYKPITKDPRVTGNEKHAAEVQGGEGTDHWKDAEKTGVVRGRDSVIVRGREVLVKDISPEGRGTIDNPRKSHVRSPHRYHAESLTIRPNNSGLPPMPQLTRRTTEQLGLTQLSQLPPVPLTDDTDIGGPPMHLDSTGNLAPRAFNPATADIKIAPVNKDCMRDPLNDCFFEDIWRLVAENNTKIFRRVFRCNPDSEVTNWHEYTEFVAYAERFAQSQGETKSKEREEQEAPGKSGPPGATLPGAGSAVPGLANISEKVIEHARDDHPLGTVSEWAESADRRNKERRARANSHGMAIDGGEVTDEKAASWARLDEAPSPIQPAGDETFPSYETTINPPSTDADRSPQYNARKATFSSVPDGVSLCPTASMPTTQGSAKKRRRGTTKGSRRGFAASDGLLNPNDIEELLSLIQGHLVLFPYDWLIKEELNSNWLYQVDQVAPLQIYD